MNWSTILLLEHNLEKEFVKGMRTCLLIFLSKHPEHGILGISIIYEDLLSTRIDQLRTDQPLPKKCFFCQYEESKTVFCLDHFLAVQKTLPTHNADKLKTIQLGKLQNLKEQLTEVIRKHDYKNKESIGLEAKAYRYVAKLIANLNTSFGRMKTWQLWKNSRER
ncbi:hypothetical protein Theth_1589 [Pseudothermotoga thermarum DSM 5069]|uniref:Uncharacterized protein n=2 Tax=Pseudothermotoga thermarum TaxID=119394 RepID=F7YVI7_9THEM|nr:hypothetical protein Theth_1589 [Pseudothermotoga thermarum DSM 5069]